MPLRLLSIHIFVFNLHYKHLW